MRLQATRTEPLLRNAKEANHAKKALGVGELISLFQLISQDATPAAIPVVEDCQNVPAHIEGLAREELELDLKSMRVRQIRTAQQFQTEMADRLEAIKESGSVFELSPRLIIKQELPKGEAGQINVVLNWFEELKRLVPVTTG